MISKSTWEFAKSQQVGRQHCNDGISEAWEEAMICVE